MTQNNSSLLDPHKQVNPVPIQTLRKVSFDTNSWHNSSSTTRLSKRARCPVPESQSQSIHMNDDISAPRFLEQWNASQHLTTRDYRRPITETHSHHNSPPTQSTMSPSSRKLSRLSRSGCLKALVNDDGIDSNDAYEYSYGEGRPSHNQTGSGNSAVPSVSDDDLQSNSDTLSCEHSNTLLLSSGHELDLGLDDHFASMSQAFSPLPETPSSTSDTDSSSTSTTTTPCSGWGHFVDVIPTDRSRDRHSLNVPRKSKSKMSTSIKRLASFRRRYKSFSMSPPSSSTLKSPTHKKGHPKHKLRCVDTISSALHRMTF